MECNQPMDVSSDVGRDRRLVQQARCNECLVWEAKWPERARRMHALVRATMDAGERAAAVVAAEKCAAGLTFDIS